MSYKLLGALLALPLFAVPAQAQPAKAPNSVSCVYDMMPQGDKDNAIDLLMPDRRRPAPEADGTKQPTATDKGQGKNPAKDQARQEFAAIVNDAFDACLDAHPWSSGRATNAEGYVMFALMRDMAARLFQMSGTNMDDIDNYYALNRAKFSKIKDWNGPWVAEYRQAMAGRDWAQKDESLLAFGEAYLLALASMDQLKIGFARGTFFNAPPPLFSDPKFLN